MKLQDSLRLQHSLIYHEVNSRNYWPIYVETNERISFWPFLNRILGIVKGHIWWDFRICFRLKPLQIIQLPVLEVTYRSLNKKWRKSVDNMEISLMEFQLLYSWSLDHDKIIGQPNVFTVQTRKSVNSQKNNSVQMITQCSTLPGLFQGIY